MIEFNKGPKTPTKTPDSLITDDTVEVLIGLSEGPIRGPSGPQDFFLDDTPLVSQDGVSNFSNFALDFWPGAQTGHIVEMHLGGASSPVGISQTLLYNVPVVRQGLQININAIDVRLVVQRLMLSNDKGTFKQKLDVRIEIKAVSEATWRPAWYAVASAPGTITYTPGDSGGSDPDAWAGDSGDYFGRLTGDYVFDFALNQGVGAPTGIPRAGVNQKYIDTTDSTGIYTFRTTDMTWVRAPLVPGSAGVEGRFYYTSSTTPTSPVLGDLWRPTLGELYVFNGLAFVLPGEYYDDKPLGLNETGIWSITDKATSNTARDLRIFVEPINEPYQLRVTKLTGDSTDEVFTDISWESIQEITRGPIPFTGVATARILGRASDQFTGVPNLSSVNDGRIVRVPSNYDPIARTYTGVWDGIYKLEYTNCTAWILQDFIEDDVYGLSSIYPHTVNKWKFYEFGQYCDEMVERPDASMRPRWTFNDYITDARDGSELCQYIAASAGARVIDDGNGYCDLIIDRADDPAVMLFTPENISPDGFEYTYTDRYSRSNEVIVEFINPLLNWLPDKRRITDDADITTFGRITDNFIAVGCTDVDEAMARGRRRLIGGLTEKELVGFKTNRKGKYLELFSTVLVADPKMGRSITGRLTAVTSPTTATIRDSITFEPGIDYWATFDTSAPGGQTVTERVKITTVTGTPQTSLTFEAAVRTNKIIHDNATPTSTAGLSTGGDLAAVVSIVDDKAAIVAADLYHLVRGGQVYKLDNSLGTGDAFVIITANNGNTSAHTYSVYARGGAGRLRRPDSLVGQVSFASSSTYVRHSMAATGESLAHGRVYANAGQVVYFTLQQSEQSATLGSPIPTYGANGSVTTTSVLNRLPPHAAFSIESTTLGYPKPYVVIGIEDEGGDGENIAVSLRELNRNKQAFIDSGPDLGEVNYDQIDFRSVEPVPSAQAAATVQAGAWLVSLTWGPSPSQNVRTYEVEHYVNDTLINTASTTGLSYEVVNAAEGSHLFVIRAVSALGHKSRPGSTGLNLVGVSRVIPAPTNPRVVGATLLSGKWQLKTLEPVLEWDGATFPAFSHYIITAGGEEIDVGATPRWAWLSAQQVGASRVTTVSVQTVNMLGERSTAVPIVLENKAPVAPTITLTSSTAGITVDLSAPVEDDVAGAKIVVAATPGGVGTTYDVTQSSMLIALDDFSPRYVRAAYFDNYGQTDLNWSTEGAASRDASDEGRANDQLLEEAVGRFGGFVSEVARRQNLDRETFDRFDVLGAVDPVTRSAVLRGGSIQASGGGLFLDDATDRTAAGLSVSGVLQTAIPSTLADASNILQRTGGGTFTGATNANYTTNTNQLTDGANLGATAIWATVSGTGRPADNATVGATWGTNVGSRPTELTDGRVVLALEPTGVLKTAIPSTLADASNILQRTGGGTFTGATNANYTTNTNQLTDGANLGATAVWATVSGTGRPADNATRNVGALADLDLVTAIQLGVGAVDLASNKVTGKSLSNIDSAAALRLDGVELVTDNLGDLATLDFVDTGNIVVGAITAAGSNYPTGTSSHLTLHTGGSGVQPVGVSTSIVTTEGGEVEYRGGFSMRARHETDDGWYLTVEVIRTNGGTATTVYSSTSQSIAINGDGWMFWPIIITLNDTPPSGSNAYVLRISSDANSNFYQFDVHTKYSTAREFRR